MNSNQAISRLRFLLDVGGSDGFTGADKEALNMAIKSLAAGAGEQPRTNADCIRQMADDEELLSAIGTGCFRCAYNDDECDSGYGKGCVAGNLEWLRQEVPNNECQKER